MSLILLFGADGQVGWELQRSLSILGDVMPLTRARVDLSDAQSVRDAIRAIKPASIVNAAAYTAVDKAENETDLAFAINAAAPALMAEEARVLGIPLVHYSTDYAYGGDKQGRYVESDAPDPRSAYARSKVAGDEAVLGSGAQALVLRTSWVFAARGSNFLRTILRLASERESMRIVSDQAGAPTSAELLADVTARVLASLGGSKPSRAMPPVKGGQDAVSGLFHCTSAGETTWHGYARYIVAEARALGANLKLVPDNIEAITTEQYPTPAVRPRNSRLDCSKLERTFDVRLPQWQVHVRRTLIELLTRT